MARVLLLLLALVTASMPARADMTATYQNPLLGASLTIQIAENGDARLQFAHQAWRIQIVGDEAYAVYPPIGGTVRVASVSDIQRRLAELRPRTPPAPAPGQTSLVRRGEVTIAGYRGIAYYRNLPPPPAGIPELPALVVSRDPTLADLGRIIIRQLDFSIATAQIMGTTIPPAFVGMRELIGSGAPLSFIGFELVSIDRSPIDPARLRLPAPPMTLEELRVGGVPNIS